MGVNSGRQVVALCPGSINSRAKRWPAERYALLADRLIEEACAAVILIGSAAESDIAEEVRGRMKHEPIVMTGKTDLTKAVAILSQVDLLVTNDTGPAHIAAALNRPTLVIFGPTNPLTTGPLSQHAEIVREPPDCAPCMLRDCPIDHRCMTAISPSQVFERAVTMLKANTDRHQFGDRHPAESLTDSKRFRYSRKLRACRTPEMSRAVFMDRDGTISEEVGYVNHPSRFRLFPFSPAIKLLNDAGWLAIVITNQAGVLADTFPKR